MKTGFLFYGEQANLGEAEGDLLCRALAGELRRLHKLREDGIISEQEYAETKQRILKEA